MASDPIRFPHDNASAQRYAGLPTCRAASIYRDGILHMRLNESMANVRNRILGLYNTYPGHHWSCDDE